MAWNESGNGQNPWDRGKGNQGPPDLDKIVRDWQRKLSALFGGKGGGDGQGSGDGASGSMITLLLVLILLAWAATGVYRVNEAERGIVLRFGAYVATTMPGLRWHIPWPVEQVERINVAEISTFRQETRMLTADENIVVVDLVVQYQRPDPVKFLFEVRDPEATLSDVSESAIREVIGKNPIDFVLLGGRAEIALRTQDVIQEALDEYATGMTVTKVNLQNVNFPSQVEAAVQDAIKAREDKERLTFEAQTYSNDILPKARGEASRRMLDSEAYKARVVADAQGESARFEKLLSEYEKAPEVTRERLYIEALEDVYARSNKVILDAKGSGNLLYLPMDKLIEQGRSSSTPAGSAGNRMGGGAGSDTASSSRLAPRDSMRVRGAR
ncbi:MAG: FtsH protease activity modulator HflK [Gammaproteobacteria bacterium]